MHKERISALLDALDLGETPADRDPSLTDLASRTLRQLEVTLEEEARATMVNRELTVSFANVGLGVGFASWVAYEAVQGLGAGSFDRGVDSMFAHAEKWGGFLVEVLTRPENWDDIPHLIQHFFENAASVPIGTIQLAADIIDSLEHGGAFIDNFDAIGGMADLADVADAATTFGLSILLSYAAGKVADGIVDRRMRPLAERYATLQGIRVELAKLQHALATGVPAPALLPHLDRLPTERWAF
jgi:hypothetical protein